MHLEKSSSCKLISLAKYNCLKLGVKKWTLQTQIKTQIDYLSTAEKPITLDFSDITVFNIQNNTPINHAVATIYRHHRMLEESNL